MLSSASDGLVQFSEMRRNLIDYSSKFDHTTLNCLLINYSGRYQRIFIIHHKL